MAFRCSAAQRCRRTFQQGFQRDKVQTPPDGAVAADVIVTAEEDRERRRRDQRRQDLAPVPGQVGRPRRACTARSAREDVRACH